MIRVFSAGIVLLLLPLFQTASAQQSKVRRAIADSIVHELRLQSRFERFALSETFPDQEVRATVLATRDLAATYLREESFEPAVSELYAANFSTDELRELLQFYRTPAGKHLTQIKELLDRRIGLILEKELAPHVDELPAIRRKYGGTP